MMNMIKCLDVQDGVVHFLCGDVSKEHMLVTSEDKKVFIRYNETMESIGLSDEPNGDFQWHLLSGAKSLQVGDSNFDIEVMKVIEGVQHRLGTTIREVEAVPQSASKSKSISKKLTDEMKAGDCIELKDIFIHEDGAVDVGGDLDPDYVDIDVLVKFYNDHHCNGNVDIKDIVKVDIKRDEAIEVPNESHTPLVVNQEEPIVVEHHSGRFSVTSGCVRNMADTICDLKVEIEELTEENEKLKEINKEGYDNPIGLDKNYQVEIGEKGETAYLSVLRYLAKVVYDKFHHVDDTLTLKWDKEISIEIGPKGSTASSKDLVKQLNKVFENPIVDPKGVTLEIEGIESKTLDELISNFKKAISLAERALTQKQEEREKTIEAEDNFHNLEIRHNSILEENEVLKVDLANALVSSEGFSATDVIKITNAHDPETLLMLKEKGII